MNTRWTDERIEAALKLSASNTPRMTPATAKAIADEAQRERLKMRVRRGATVAAVLAVGFAMLLMAGCSDSGGGGVRATAEALGTRFPGGRSEASATPFPTFAAPALQYVEATREVEVTRIVEVTATPAIQGFPADAGYVMPVTGVDESIQPCPVPFWKNGQCTATQAEIDAYALGNE